MYIRGGDPNFTVVIIDGIKVNNPTNNRGGSFDFSTEEVDVVVKSGNYGWNKKEGTHCFNPDKPNEHPAACPDNMIEGVKSIEPVLEYPSLRTRQDGKGISVTGGYVYRGTALP